MTDYLSRYVTEAGFDIPKLLNDDFFAPIKLLFNNRHYVSATKLRLIFIDTMSFLESGWSDPSSFQDWLDRYVDLKCLAWISTEGNSPKIWVPPAANRRLRARPPATGRGAGLPVQARIRRGRPFHQGTLTRELRIPESMMMGRCALRWNSTVTSESPSVTVAGMSMRSRKMRFACASS